MRAAPKTTVHDPVKGDKSRFDASKAGSAEGAFAPNVKRGRAPVNPAGAARKMFDVPNPLKK